jgi:hypothetical protein
MDYRDEQRFKHTALHPSQRRTPHIAKPEPAILKDKENEQGTEMLWARA